MSTATAVHHDDDATYDLVPESAPAAVSRPRVLLIGTAFAVAAIVTLFAGLIGIYLSVRHGVITGEAVDGQAPVWFADGGPIPLTPANIALGTMALSCVSMAWAVYAVSNNDRAGAIFALCLTLLFGFAVINATTFLYTQSGISIAGGSNPSGLLFYAVTGTHIALIVGAMVFASIMTLRTLGGEYSGRDREGIVAASIIWYLTAAVMAVIWYAVYVTK